MDSKLNNLPPMKRFRLLEQQNNQKPEPKPDTTPKQSPISPSRLPTKKRKQSRSPPFHDENILPPTPTPNLYSLPAKKRIWAFRPDSPLTKIDLNVEYKTLKDEEDEDEDGIMCGVCESTDGDPIDPIVFCDGCDLMVHSSCYGNPLIKSIPDGNWFCEHCNETDKNKYNSIAKCCLCPVIGGAMKRTNDGKWAHIVCAVFVPEVFFVDPEGRDGIDCSMVLKRRWNQVCYLCKKQNGCVVDCSEPNCPMSFHVTCGLKHDLCIELNQGRTRRNTSGGIVAAFCRKHTDIWNKQQRSGKFKIVARNEE